MLAARAPPRPRVAASPSPHHHRRFTLHTRQRASHHCLSAAKTAVIFLLALSEMAPKEGFDYFSAGLGKVRVQGAAVFFFQPCFTVLSFLH